MASSLSSSPSSWCFVGFLVVVWNGSLYANGCYTSIISFGDSIADTGNIKHLGAITNQAFPSLFPPYGQTFFNKSTGRCSDGRLIIDFLAESLGLPLIPPYMQAGSDNALELGHGVNYAVAGATALGSLFLGKEGIQNPVSNASLGIELGWFKHSLHSFCDNASDCKNLIGRSLILVGEVGGNDYNFPILDGNPIDDVKSFVPIVINTIVSIINVRSYFNHTKYVIKRCNMSGSTSKMFCLKTHHLKCELIEMGAQTLVVPGNFPIGCSSAYLTVCGSENEEYDPTTGCLVRLNQFVEYHNEYLQTKLNQIRELHPNVNIIYADYYNAAMQIYRSPYKFGFTNGALKACCGGGGQFNYNLTTKCGDESATVCAEPSTYANWDGIHLTEAAYKVIFEGLFQGPYTTPAFSSLCPTSPQRGAIGLSSS
ncbi:putative sinapine esterase [Helianthus annuus]|nr:putative sinapine esterase [Helianthus annuus]KAJ0633924.1 putative sinapine esterase [Helianthus annuus]